MAQLDQSGEAPVLEVRGITKRFPGVLANDNINFRLQRGEVLAFLGENGAGKSTLMNILYGLYHPDEGEVLLNGKPLKFSGPNEAIRAGIGMVHQHFMLVPTLTVTENIILGNEIAKGGGRLDLKTASKNISELSARYGLALDPNVLVGDLTVGMQQRVEIVKAFYRNANILILDEPTSVLTPQEADDLANIIRNFTAQGKSVIFISHKLREVLQIADRVVVLRGGKVVGSVDDLSKATEASLASLMVGREVVLQVNKGPSHPGEEVLVVHDVKALDDRGVAILQGASLSVRTGEILGVAGVEGNGQIELVEVLTHLRHATGGSATLNGMDLLHSSTRKITEAGVGYIPQDRQRFAMVLSFGVDYNMVLSSYYREPFSNGLTINEKKVDEYALELVKRFDVRTPTVQTPSGSLSGGNQQKCVVGREFSRKNKLMIAVQPTRGLDVGSIEFIHNGLVEQRDAGVAVLLVSSELDEVMSLSDRIAVMYKGRVVAIVEADKVTREELGLLMAGAGTTAGAV
ncbi:MAG: ABC transporter ATP-binding protein [Chloroflexi bacterium]|uniref:ABC transporter ATP-binding protein n=1 Tax=Candidatus Chlorohelix allophototropha TaxID=3003348 RepID=A0A8T7M3K8_9CHLR|nr:ABC transporter ATP-binding protein [Chloroflexota bacterium]WJW65591.1 ABC transporter ATP-binding protein [Chloroflexota bacterium L227-S17]